MIVFAQGIVGIAYPVFNAIFINFSGAQQTLFAFAMPVIKFVTKQIIANRAASFHEYVGPIVVFSVDVFNVFYASICLQTATSATTALIIIAPDSFSLVLAVYDIFRHSKLGQSHVAKINTLSKSYLGKLQELVVAQNSNPIQNQTHRFRVHAPFEIQLSDESKAFMNNLIIATQHACQSDTTEPMVHATTRLIASCNIRNTRGPTLITREPSIPPKVTESPAVAPSAAVATNAFDFMSNEETVYEALQTLFHSEYVLMTEYIDFMLPILYTAYLALTSAPTSRGRPGLTTTYIFTTTRVKNDVFPRRKLKCSVIGPFKVPVRNIVNSRHGAALRRRRQVRGRRGGAAGARLAAPPVRGLPQVRPEVDQLREGGVGARDAGAARKPPAARDPLLAEGQVHGAAVRSGRGSRSEAGGSVLSPHFRPESTG
ncbi:unnamed protein product [Phytophthora lilii]|uniref:Unnamed protein product n=1 Tax=Phytophthora lilii TaxID=2077276 RepID=A0A9W6X3G6_9STRA|nr:unnamed protein product [Phytophthora lilii]